VERDKWRLIFTARCPGADFTLVTNEWLDRNIRKKGPLGAEYPRWDYLMEGDTRASSA